MSTQSPCGPTAAQLVALGATNVAEFDEPEGHWITMLDPEGNEFCLH